MHVLVLVRIELSENSSDCNVVKDFILKALCIECMKTRFVSRPVTVKGCMVGLCQLTEPDTYYSGGSRISGRGGLITIFTSGGGYWRGRAPSRNS